jgi:hypothetical protein
MTNANIVTIAGRPHDIRCPQSGRTDVSDCCKPMVAFAATMEERERCAKIAESPICTCKEEEIHDGCCGSCGNRIAKVIREGKS